MGQRPSAPGRVVLPPQGHGRGGPCRDRRPARGRGQDEHGRLRRSGRGRRRTGAAGRDGPSRAPTLRPRAFAEPVRLGVAQGHHGLALQLRLGHLRHPRPPGMDVPGGLGPGAGPAGLGTHACHRGRPRSVQPRRLARERRGPGPHVAVGPRPLPAGAARRHDRGGVLPRVCRRPGPDGLRVQAASLPHGRGGRGHGQGGGPAFAKRELNRFSRPRAARSQLWLHGRSGPVCDRAPHRPRGVPGRSRPGQDDLRRRQRGPGAVELPNAPKRGAPSAHTTRPERRGRHRGAQARSGPLLPGHPRRRGQERVRACDRAGDPRGLGRVGPAHDLPEPHRRAVGQVAPHVASVLRPAGVLHTRAAAVAVRRQVEGARRPARLALRAPQRRGAWGAVRRHDRRRGGPGSCPCS